MKLKRIYRTNNASEAHLICNRLEDEGVRANVVGDALPYAGTGLAGLLEVWTSQQDAPRAVQLLREWNLEPADEPPKFYPLRFSMLALVLLTTCVAMSFASAHALMMTSVIASCVFTLAILIHIVRRKLNSQHESVLDTESRGD